MVRSRIGGLAYVIARRGGPTLDAARANTNSKSFALWCEAFRMLTYATQKVEKA